MSAVTVSSSTESWQQALARAIRDPDELVSRLELPEACREPARRAAGLFPLLVPESYLERMEPGNPHDPLLRQVLPLDAEFVEMPGFTRDAVDDTAARTAPGLLQKYAGRALVIMTGACAVHCRYCFRRHYPYDTEPRSFDDWQPALDVLRNDSSLQEVILSGGDPLLWTDARLERWLRMLDEIPHLTRLRIHTRLPIVLPERITPRCLDVLQSTHLTPICVVHANHPRELAGSCGPTLRQMVRAGITVLNQAVLLRGVNDDVETLAALCGGLIDLGAMPYYLHQLDRVAGTHHFEVPEETGRKLISELRQRLPGYAVPEYVREVPHAPHKVPLI